MRIFWVGCCMGLALTVSSWVRVGTILQSAVTVGANSVSVWQVAGGEPGPSVGSIGPTVGQPGMVVTIAGDNFGAECRECGDAGLLAALA